MITLNNLESVAVIGALTFTAFSVAYAAYQQYRLEKDYKSLLKEFLKIKKSLSRRPTAVSCTSCGRKTQVKQASLVVGRNGEGEIKRVSLLCPACLGRERENLKVGDDIIQATAYAGKLESFLADKVFPFRLSKDFDYKELYAVCRNLVRWDK